MKKLKIVFVPRRSRIRLYKIAKSLQYSGKVQMILLCEESFYDEKLFAGIFDEVIFFTGRNVLFKLPKAEKIYRKINERFGIGFRRLVKKLDEIQADIVHCFAEPYNHIEFILKHTNHKVVMTDGADFTAITLGFENTPGWVWRQEKYCFENVSGILHKGPAYEIDFYRNHGCKIACPEITWFDHCDDELIISKEVRTLDSSHDPHIVLTGNISTDPAQSYIYYIDFAKEMARQRIHLHIYPNPYQYHVAKEYRRLSRESPYFHFHAPKSYRDLGKEITRYDWGLWWHDPAGGIRDSDDKNKVALGNKIFTYLEAGLPVIVGRHLEYGRDFVEKHGIGIAIEKSDIPDLRNMLQTNYSLNMQNVKDAAQQFRLSANAESLIGFYENVSGIR